jgi:tRNA-specific 2-thiouridylase
MSGGVDSSVAATLLVEQGYEVSGVTLNLAPQTTSIVPGKAMCCGVAEIADARQVCDRLRIPHYALDLRAEFDRLVIQDFVAQYRRGRTPNPCIRCNQLLKFEALRRWAGELGAQAIATGHYARIARANGMYHLLRGVDEEKDQSYFLYTLTQDQMAQIRFPIGGLTKDQVRAKAAELALPVADKSESQDVCFAPDGDYSRLLASHSGESAPPGKIAHVDGRVLGTHRGIGRYTIGQRRGLGIAWREPLYVVAIDPDANRIVVGPDSALWGKEFLVEGTNFAPDVPERAELALTCRVRRNMTDVAACLVRLGPDTARARFETPVRAITPGQAAVFYDGERVLGGGTIAEVVG